MTDSCSKKKLKDERRWSERLIRMFLGPPDDTAPNPYCERHPMQLFNVSRVLKVEATPEFKAEFDKTELRRAKREKLDPAETYFWANWRDQH